MNAILNLIASGKVNLEQLKEGSVGRGLLGGLLSEEGLQGVVDHGSMGGESGSFEQYLDNNTEEATLQEPSKVWSTTLSESPEADITPMVTAAVQSSMRVLPHRAPVIAAQSVSVGDEMPKPEVNGESYTSSCSSEPYVDFEAVVASERPAMPHEKEPLDGFQVIDKE